MDCLFLKNVFRKYNSKDKKRTTQTAMSLSGWPNEGACGDTSAKRMLETTVGLPMDISYSRVAYGYFSTTTCYLQHVS